MDYAAAHGLAAGMVVFAFLVLLALYLLNSRGRRS
jgi:ABC-type sulfate transport system permease component